MAGFLPAQNSRLRTGRCLNQPLTGSQEGIWKQEWVKICHMSVESALRQNQAVAEAVAAGILKRQWRRHFDSVRSVGSTHDWHAAVEPVSLYWPAGHAQGQNRVQSERKELQSPIPVP